MAKRNSTFYEVDEFTGQLQEGHELLITRKMYYHGQYTDIKSLLNTPIKELEKRLKDSKVEEQKIYKDLQNAAQNWEQHGAQTLLLQKTIDYLKTPEVKHTSNEWKRKKDGVWEISNRVYIMRYKITQEAGGKHQGQWLVTWGIAINCPPRPSTEKFYSSGNVMVVEQKKKYYNAEADAQNYIQGRFDEYAHLFMELSPPVPDKFKHPFYISGILLPGYTVAPKEKSPQEVADELLDLLDDSGLAPPPDPEPPKAPKEPSPPQGKASPEKPAQKRNPSSAKKPVTKKKAAVKKRSAPIR